MIRLSGNLVKSLIKRQIACNTSPRYFFAKQPKGGKENKKGAKLQKKQQPPVELQPIEKLLPHERLIHYFTPLQPGLSPSQVKSIQKNVLGLAEPDKQMLDRLAERIAELNTSMYYNLVFNRQALGTSESYIVGSGSLENKQVTEAIKVLRKDI